MSKRHVVDLQQVPGIDLDYRPRSYFWALDANLAAGNDFGVTGTTTIVPDVSTSVTVTVPSEPMPRCGSQSRRMRAGVSSHGSRPDSTIR